MLRKPARHTAVLSLVAALALAGCGGDDPATAPTPQPTDPLPPGTPLNDTPANTMTRLGVAYGEQELASYLALLSADFRFNFSNQSDPELVNQFGDTWGVSDDSASTAHLFAGFTNDVGDYVPGATGITLSLPGQQFVTDPDHADSAAHYRVVIVPTVLLLLDVPGTDGIVIASPHNFYLVRGDAAVLRAGQPADSTRWYVWRQTDLSPDIAARVPGDLAPARILPARTLTWGSVKANYR